MFLCEMQFDTYREEYERMQSMTREKYLASLRRSSSGFARGVSKYRGVARSSMSILFSIAELQIAKETPQSV